MNNYPHKLTPIKLCESSVRPVLPDKRLLEKTAKELTKARSRLKQIEHQQARERMRRQIQERG